jgi:hypothetical protein
MSDWVMADCFSPALHSYRKAMAAAETGTEKTAGYGLINMPNNIFLLFNQLTARRICCYW